MASPPFDLFAPLSGGGSFSTDTIGTLATAVPAGTSIAVAYVHNANAKDTITLSLARGATQLGGTWTVLPDAILTSNSQTFMAIISAPVNLLTGDTITVLSSVSRARREMHARAFPGQVLTGAVSGVFQSNTAPPSVTLTAVPAQSVIFAVVGSNATGGAVTFGAPGYTDTKTISSTAGTSDKTLTDAYRYTSLMGTTTVDATLTTAGPSGMVAVALPPAAPVTYVNGTTYQFVFGQWQ